MRNNKLKKEEKDNSANNDIKRSISKEIFDHMIDMLKHEDEKANRILTAMAFLTAAAAAISIPFFEDKIGLRIVFLELDLNLGLLLFFLYLIFVVIGTFFMLAALGPILFIPRLWGETRNDDKKDKICSLLFFKKITAVKRQDWKNFFNASHASKISKKIFVDRIYESHLLAEKVDYKVNCIGKANFLYRFALLILWLLILSVLARSFYSFSYWACLFLAVFFTEWAFELSMIREEEDRKKAYPFIILAYISMILVYFLLFWIMI